MPERYLAFCWVCKGVNEFLNDGLRHTCQACGASHDYPPTIDNVIMTKMEYGVLRNYIYELEKRLEKLEKKGE